MASRKNVPAATVRAWFNEAQPEGVPAPGSRGRLHPDTIAAFHKANPRLRYETGVAEAPTFEVPVTTLDKAGRKTTVKRTFTNEQARLLLGQTVEKDGRTVMQRGRMNHSLLALAASAVEANELADNFR